MSKKSAEHLSVWRFIMPAVLVITLVLLASCGDSKKAQAVAPSAAPVTVATAQVQDVPVTVSAVGNIQPYSTVQVKSMVTAPVLTVHFKPGDFVKKGQLLFALDPRSFQADLVKAQGQLAKDTAAAANARRQAERYAALYKEGVVAREQNDLQQSSSEQWDAAIEADKGQVESAKINLQYAKIYSPIEGRAGDVLIYAGNIIKANDATMVVINQVTPIYVDYNVPERLLPEIKKYMAAGSLRVNAVFPDAAQAVAEGKLSFIDNTVDPKTGTIGLKASFPNSDHRLWPGQFVNVVTSLNTLPKAVVVPLSAVQNGQKGPYLYVVKQDQTVDLRQVELGPQIQNTQVIRNGVQPGETVVTDGQMRLTPGAKVDAKTAGSQGASANSNVQKSS